MFKCFSRRASLGPPWLTKRHSSITWIEINWGLIFIQRVKSDLERIHFSHYKCFGSDAGFWKNHQNFPEICNSICFSNLKIINVVKHSGAAFCIITFPIFRKIKKKQSVFFKFLFNFKVFAGVTVCSTVTQNTYSSTFLIFRFGKLPENYEDKRKKNSNINLWEILTIFSKTSISAKNKRKQIRRPVI